MTCEEAPTFLRPVDSYAVLLLINGIALLAKFP